MNLAELTSVVSAEAGVSKDTAREIIKTTIGAIQLEVEKGGRVSIVGFGAFYSATRSKRVGRNPKTGEEIPIAAVTIPRFKPGKDFKEGVKKRLKPRRQAKH